MLYGAANGGGCFFPTLVELGARAGRTFIVDWRGAGLSGRPEKFPPKTEAEAIDFLVEGEPGYSTVVYKREEGAGRNM